MPRVPGWDLWLKAVFLAERAAFQAGTGTENALRLGGTIPTVQRFRFQEQSLQASSIASHGRSFWFHERPQEREKLAVPSGALSWGS